MRNRFTRDTGMPYSNYIGDGTALDVRSDLGGLNLSTVPKVFIECGNMRNATDAATAQRCGLAPAGRPGHRGRDRRISWKAPAS